MHVDGENGSTGVVEATIQLLLPEGATCDPAGGRDRCGPELTCGASSTCEPAGCGVAEKLVGTGTFDRIADTSAAASAHAGTCGQGNDGGVRAPEVVYSLELASGVSNVHITTDSPMTTFDTLVYVRNGCTGSEVVCNDDNGTARNPSELDTGPLPAGTYLIFIDGFSTNRGTAAVSIVVTP